MFDREVFRKSLETHVRQQSSIAAICRKAGINRQQFNKYLSGENVPSLATTCKIAEVLGVGLEQLLGLPGDADGGNDPDGLDALFEANSTTEPRIVEPGHYVEISTLDLSADRFLLGQVELRREGFGGRFIRNNIAQRLDGTRVEQKFRGRYFEGGDKVMVYYANITSPNTLGTLCLRRLDSYGYDLVGFKVAHRFDKTREPMASPVALKYMAQRPDDAATGALISECHRDDLPQSIALVADYMLSQLKYENFRLRL